MLPIIRDDVTWVGLPLAITKNTAGFLPTMKTKFYEVEGQKQISLLGTKQTTMVINCTLTNGATCAGSGTITTSKTCGDIAAGNFIKQVNCSGAWTLGTSGSNQECEINGNTKTIFVTD